MAKSPLAELEAVLDGELVETGLVEKVSIAGEALQTTLEGLVSSQLAANTRRAYRQDAAQFVAWLAERDLGLVNLSHAEMLQYRRYLSDNFAPTSASRKLVVARRLLEEALERGLIAHNPAQRVKGIEAAQESTYNALSKAQARQLIEAIDTSSLQGKRDYAMLLLLLKTGIRRSECAALCLGDLQQEQGHPIAILRQTKGRKRRMVKLAAEVRRAIDQYLAASGRANLGNEAPLFVQFRKGDHPQPEGISTHLIQRVLEKYTELAGLEMKLTPHSLRATFVTLALEGGAKLQQVQYAVGHADPRTTERYQKRKLNLDDAATDYVKF
jgi:site-specific recombinase XerD